MRQFKQFVAALALAVSMFGGAPAAYADPTATTQATVTITPGDFTIASNAAPLVFADFVLTGADYTRNGATSGPTFTVTDARGSGAGWHVTLQSSDFTQTGDATKKILASGFSFTAGGTITRVSGEATGPVNTANSGSLDAGIKVVTTPANSGRGVYTYAPAVANFSLEIPATTAAGDYSATMTATLTSAP